MSASRKREREREAEKVRVEKKEYREFRGGVRVEKER